MKLSLEEAKTMQRLVDGRIEFVREIGVEESSILINLKRKLNLSVKQLENNQTKWKWRVK